MEILVSKSKFLSVLIERHSALAEEIFQLLDKQKSLKDLITSNEEHIHEEAAKLRAEQCSYYSSSFYRCLRERIVVAMEKGPQLLKEINSEESWHSHLVTSLKVAELERVRVPAWLLPTSD